MTVSDTIICFRSGKRTPIPSSFRTSSSFGFADDYYSSVPQLWCGPVVVWSSSLSSGLGRICVCVGLSDLSSISSHPSAHACFSLGSSTGHLYTATKQRSFLSMVWPQTPILAWHCYYASGYLRFHSTVAKQTIDQCFSPFGQNITMHLFSTMKCRNVNRKTRSSDVCCIFQ